MTDMTPEITPFQRENLQRLAAYLSTGQTAMRFDMKEICRGEISEIYFADKHDCGTVGCALGHGPAAGIEPLIKENWLKYSQRCFFESGKDDCGMPKVQEGWLWCFGDHWKKTDNTPQGAAARILYMLTHGVPENWEAQMNGEDELCYREEAASC